MYLTENELRFLSATAYLFLEKGVCSSYSLEYRFNEVFEAYGFSIGEELFAKESERKIYWLKLPFMKKNIINGVQGVIPELKSYGDYLTTLISKEVLIRKNKKLWWNFTRRCFDDILKNTTRKREPIIYKEVPLFLEHQNESFGKRIIFYDDEKQVAIVEKISLSDDFYLKCKYNLDSYLNEKFGV